MSLKNLDSVHKQYTSGIKKVILSQCLKWVAPIVLIKTNTPNGSKIVFLAQIHKARNNMNIQCTWLNSDKHVFISPLRYSWYSDISLKGVNSLIETRELSFISIEKKLLIPVPSKRFFALMNAEKTSPNFEVDWNGGQEHVPY